MAKLNRLLSFVFLLMVSFSTSAQQFEVNSFQKSISDLTAIVNPRIDLNGNACGLIKVQVPIQGLTFEGNVVGDVDFKGGEYWVYVCDNSKRIVLKHNNASPTTIEFGEFGISTIEAKNTYILKVNVPVNVVEQTEDVAFKIVPSNAILTIDNVEYETQSGKANINLSCGEHTYLVVAPGYRTQSNMFRVSKNANNKIVIELDTKDGNQTENLQVSQPLQSSYSSNVANNVIGYYDEKRVLTSIPDIVKAQKQLEETSKKYEQEYQVLTNEMQKKYDEYQNLGSDVSNTIKERRAQELADFNNKINTYKTEATKDLEAMQTRLMKPWTDKFQTTLSVVKTNKGLVSTQDINSSRLNGIQYVDITDDIINMLSGKSTGNSTVMIGVYDTDKVLNQHPSVIAAQKELSDLSKQYESEYAKKQERLNDLFTQYQKLEKDPNELDAIKERRLQEITDLQKQLEEYTKTATETLQNRQTELIKPIRDKIETALSVISAQRGLASTQDTGASRLGGNIKYIDITDEVVKMIK